MARVLHIRLKYFCLNKKDQEIVPKCKGRESQEYLENDIVGSDYLIPTGTPCRRHRPLYPSTRGLYHPKVSIVTALAQNLGSTDITKFYLLGFGLWKSEKHEF